MTAPSCTATPSPISAVTRAITAPMGPYMASLLMIDEDAVHAMKKPRPVQQTAVASPVRKSRRQGICPDSRQCRLHHQKATVTTNCAMAAAKPAACSGTPHSGAGFFCDALHPKKTRQKIPTPAC